MAMTVKNRLDFIVPAAAALVFAVLRLLGATGGIEQRIYDLFLHVKPAIAENPSITLLDIDNLGISKVGVYPWSRDVMADGLMLMREFDAAYAVFDILYENTSPGGVDTFTLRQTVPDAFNQEFSQIQTNIQGLFDALRTGNIQLREASRYVTDLEELTNQGKDKLLSTVQKIRRDNDDYFGRAARFFGSGFFALNMPVGKDQAIPTDSTSVDPSAYALENVTIRADFVPKAPLVIPPIPPIASGARGVGFPNVIVDSDGVRRRIDLIRGYQGRYYGQLAFRPLLDWLGNPQIVLQKRAILLKGAKVPGKGERDVRIPLAADGTFIINWPHGKFLDSFHHHSFYELVYHKKMEDDLIYNLGLMRQSGYLSYYKGETGLMDIYSYAESLKSDMLGGGDLAQMEEYKNVRSVFFNSVGDFLNGDAERSILADIDAALALKALSAEQRKTYTEIRAQVPDLFSNTKGIYDELEKTREGLSKYLPGAFCIIGLTATSTTDIGVNPFDSEFVNVGTHASIVNTILQGQFLTQAGWWWGALLALLLSFAVVLAILNLDAMRTTLVGAAFVVVVIGLLIGFFIVTGVYVDTLTPAASVFLTVLALTAIKFLRTEREKSFVRNTFAHYLSSDVISDLLSNPEKLRLGGDKKLLTAMFTDVKGFSTISEVLDATELVHLLNLYLSGMSDIILDLKGTIDKYEGDAIISFFGAPVDLPDHARRACLAAVMMRREEINLNQRFLAEKLSPSTLHTRIGINTGDMVVGNMGTPKKMDYTVMGSSVNLASRLEGVNKQYGTWIMLSDATQAAVGDEFFVRRLDRVRVVGINQPVRLFELLEEKSRVEKNVEECVGIFHEGLELFEQKQWAKAEKLFAEALGIAPEDGPSLTFRKRCQEYAVRPPADSWDGVFNLTVK
jgi:adenylate cyclase